MTGSEAIIILLLIPLVKRRNKFIRHGRGLRISIAPYTSPDTPVFFAGEYPNYNYGDLDIRL